MWVHNSIVILDTLLDAQYKNGESDSVFLLVQNLGSSCGGI